MMVKRNISISHDQRFTRPAVHTYDVPTEHLRQTKICVKYYGQGRGIRAKYALGNPIRAREGYSFNPGWKYKGKGWLCIHITKTNLGAIIIHGHTRVGTRFHCTVPVTAHCPMLNTGIGIARSVPSALASNVSGLM